MKPQENLLVDIIQYCTSHSQISASKEQWKALNAITQCRTALLGGHLYRCRSCGYTEPRYNSCRNRHCPTCQGGAALKWLKARENDLLPTSYFHTVFTVPHHLNIIFLQNQRIMYNLFFQAVAKTLTTVTKTHYNGQPGFFAVLHTWGQNMEYHPHAHIVLPGVVLKNNQSIVESSPKFFLPVRALSAVFCGILINLIKNAFNHNKLSFHGESHYLNLHHEFIALINKSVKSKWVVYSKPPISSNQQILQYLSRYTHRIAISNKRILSFENGLVTFSYKDYAKGGKKRKMTLSAKEFIRRFLQHILPGRLVKIRHYGFLANAARSNKINLIRKKLNDIKALPTQPVLPITIPVQEVPSQDINSTCPECAKDTFKCLGVLPRIRPNLIREPSKGIIPHRRFRSGAPLSFSGASAAPFNTG